MSNYGNQVPPGIPNPSSAPYQAGMPAQQVPPPYNYPTQGYSYPTQSAAPPPYTSQAMPPQPQMYGPPGVPYQPQVPQQAYPGQPQAYPGQYMPMQQPTTVVVQGGYDAGARFDVTGQSMPPPPPGIMPTVGQVAAAQGHNVVVTQRPGDFVSGGSDGGMVLW